MKGARRFVAAFTAFVMATALVPAGALADMPPTPDLSPSEGQSRPLEPVADPAPDATAQPEADQPGDPANPDIPQQPDAAPSSAPAPAAETRALGAAGPTAGSIPLRTGDDLAKIGVDPGYPLDGTYHLDPDEGSVIYVPTSFTPIGTKDAPFTGTFDGRDKSLYFAMNLPYNAGLFGYVGEGAQVKNVTVTGSLDGKTVAPFGMENAGTIEDCVVDAALGTKALSDMSVGIVVDNYGLVQNCVVKSSSVIDGASCAGIASITEGSGGKGKLVSCRNEGRVGGAQSFISVAGIVFAVAGQGRVENCENAGIVLVERNMSNSVSGVVETVEDDGVVSGCVNSGTVKNVGGCEYAAGVVAKTKNHAVVEGCTNSGQVSGRSAKTVGGIVADLDGSASLRDCTGAASGSVEGDGNVGGIVGTIEFTDGIDCLAERCVNESPVEGVENVGGIVGVNSCGLREAKNSGDVRGTKYVGGVIGRNKLTGNAERLANYGDVTGDNEVGGVAGSTEADSVYFEMTIGISHALGMAGNFGNVHGTGQDVGGVVGHASGHWIEGVFNEGDVKGGAAVGGIVGVTMNDFSDCYNLGDVEGSSMVGGLAGKAWRGSGNGAYGVKYSYTAGRVSGNEDVGALMGWRDGSTSIVALHDMYYNTDYTGGLPPFGNRGINEGYDRRIEGLTTDQMVGLGMQGKLGDDDWVYKDQTIHHDDFTTVANFYPLPRYVELMDFVCDNYFPEVYRHDFGIEGYDGSRLELFEYLETAADLERTADDPAGTYVLSRDIDLQGAPLPQLGGEGGFSGMLDGVGHVIKGIDSEHGLAESLSGRVMNLELQGAVRPSAASSAGKNVGVFVGTMHDGAMLYRCVNEASLTVSQGLASAVGGIAGATDGVDASIVECANNAPVAVEGEFVGGIVGKASDKAGSVVRSCENRGAVVGSNAVGGIAGAVDGAGCSLVSCDNYAPVSGKEGVGSANVGGVVGDLRGIASACTNEGDVTNPGQRTGGIAANLGAGGVVEKCRTSGAVNGNWKTGGLVGCVSGGSAAITGSSVEGPVIGWDYTGGLVGSIEADCTVRACSTADAGTVSGGMYVGGLVGAALKPTTIASCLGMGDVAVAVDAFGTNLSALGGAVGLADCGSLDLSNCGVVASIDYDDAKDPDWAFCVGGLVGRIQNGTAATLRQSYFSGGFSGAISDGADVKRAAVALMDAGSKGASSFDILYYNNETNLNAPLVCTDSAQAFDEAYLREHTVAGLATAGMTGEDALAGEGKMTSLNVDGIWRTRPSDDARSGSGGIYVNAYYPALDLGNTAWPSVEVIEPYDRKASEDVVAHEYTGKPIVYDEVLYDGAAYVVRGYVEKTALNASLLRTQAPALLSASASFVPGAPKDAGEYLVLIQFTDPGMASMRLQYAEMRITKKAITVKADDVHLKYMAKIPEPDEFAFTATGLCPGDDESCLDKVEWDVRNYNGQLGDYDIVLASQKDDNYDIDGEQPPGRLYITLDSIDEHYDVSYASRGLNGHDDWLVGPVTITPKNGYDLIDSATTGYGPEASHVVDLEDDDDGHRESFTLKNSQTGAVTEQGSITFNYGAPLVYASWPTGTVAPDKEPCLEYRYARAVPIEEGGGVFLVYVDGELRYTIDPAEEAKKDVEDRLLRIDDGGMYGTKLFFQITPLPVDADVVIKTQGLGPMCSKNAGAPSPARTFSFRTKGYTVKIAMEDRTVVYDGTPHEVVPKVSLAEGVTAEPPACTVTYKGSRGTAYAESETPPADAGHYEVKAEADIEGREELEPAVVACTLDIEKAPLALAAEDKERLVGEENPALTYTASGLVNGEGTDVLDTVELACAADATSAPDTYPIEFAAAADGNYEIATTPAALTVGQDGAEGRFAVSGQKGAGGHDGWYVGEVRVAPDGRDGYDLVSDDGGATWHSSLTYRSDDVPRTVDLSLLLKKSATGARTAAAQTSFNLFTKPLSVTSLAPAHGELYHDPAETVLALAFDQPVEKGRGYFTVTDANGEEFAKLNVGALRVRVSADGKTVKLRLPNAFEPYGSYTVTCNAGALRTQTYGQPFDGLSEGEWAFSVSGSSDTVSIGDMLLDVEGESAPRSAAYVGRDEADFAAAVVPGEDGTVALSLTPQVGGALADDRIKLEALDVAMLDGAAAPADAVAIDGKRLVLASGVKSARIKVTAYGQTASDSAVIMLMATGWASAVVDNRTGFPIETSNLLAAINPYDAPLLEANQVARVTLVVEPLADDEAAEAERALLRAAAGESVLGECFSLVLSIDVFEKNGPGSLVKRTVVETTEHPIAFSVLFPDDGLDHANERMLRVHDGAVDALRVAVRDDGARVFASDTFSAYAPAYDILRSIAVVPPEHGTLAVDKEQAVKGETVAVAAVPDAGYELAEVQANGRVVEGGAFTMPDEDVRVTARFAEKPKDPVPGPDDPEDPDPGKPDPGDPGKPDPGKPEQPPEPVEPQDPDQPAAKPLPTADASADAVRNVAALPTGDAALPHALLAVAVLAAAVALASTLRARRRG